MNRLMTPRAMAVELVADVRYRGIQVQKTSTTERVPMKRGVVRPLVGQ